MRRLSVLFITLLAGTGLAGDLTPGSSVFGQHDFIEYSAGDLPLVIASPHGGQLKPEEIPDRTSGVRGADVNTQELARTIADVVHEETGHHIHLVICRLHRSKLDANREVVEAAEGNALATQAWKEHHEFIDRACDKAVKQFGVAFIIDLHGHGHPDSRVELGYLQSAIDLGKGDEVLNGETCVNHSSLRWILERSPLNHVGLLRGPTSFGALLEENGFPATPSPRIPVPTEPFFSGGYTIQQHCVANRNITGLQIEVTRPRLRDTAENRLKFARALLSTLKTYFTVHLGLEIDGRKTTEPGVPIARFQHASPALQPSQ